MAKLTIKVRYSGIRKKTEQKPNGEPFTTQEFYDFLERMCRDAGSGTWTDLEAGLLRTGIDASKFTERHAVRFDPNSVCADTGTVTLVFPAENFEFAYGGLPLLLGTVAGDIIGHRDITGATVEDIEFPQELLSPDGIFGGPNCGIEGARQVLGVSGRPILAFSVKPRLGLGPGEYASLCFEAAKGGADIVEDDERLVDQPHCRMVERTKAVLNRLESDKITRTKVYSVNLTGRPDKVADRFAELLKEFGDGIRMVKFDVLPGGYSGLQSLSEAIRASGKRIPITVYPAMEYVYRTFTRKVILKLARYCGADIVYAGTPSITRTTGRHAVARLDEVLQHHHVLKSQPAVFKPCLPTVTTSLHPGHIHAMYFLLGRTDFAYFIGGAIAAYPQGARKGAELALKVINHAASGADDNSCFNRTERNLMETMKWNFLSFKELCYENKGISAMAEQFRQIK